MADFDRMDIYAPDSDLNSDNSKTCTVVIEDGSICEFWLNDWIDTVENVLAPDPFWGYCFQIADIQDSSIIIKYYNATDDVYELVQISPECITNGYRHVEKT